MSPSTTDPLARSVDRVVMQIHRSVASKEREQVQDLFGNLATSAPSQLAELIEFYGEGNLDGALLRLRFPYDDVEQSCAVILAPSERTRSTLLTLSDVILSARSKAIQGIWEAPDAWLLGVCEAALSAASGDLTSRYQTLRVPREDRELLFHFLQGLRYVRLDAHVKAWRAFELSAAEIVALTTAWAGEMPATPSQALGELGWLTPGGQITEAGIEVRKEIERRTTEVAAQSLLEFGEQSEWLGALATLSRTDG